MQDPNTTANQTPNDGFPVVPDDAFDGDPFGSVADGLDDGQVIEPQEPQATNLQEPTPQIAAPKADPNRMEYWQSRADQEAKFRQQYEPLIEFLTQDEELLSTIEAKLSQGQTPAVPRLEAPQPPQRPNNFSEVDAYQNPDGESARYLRELNNFRDKKAEYLEQKLTQLEEQRLQEVQAQKIQMEKQQRYSQTAQQLVGQFGFSQEEAVEFIRDMSDPRSLEMPVMVEFWKFAKQRAQQTLSSQQPQQKRSVAPLPGGVAPGVKTQNTNDEQAQLEGTLKGWAT